MKAKHTCFELNAIGRRQYAALLSPLTDAAGQEVRIGSGRPCPPECSALFYGRQHKLGDCLHVSPASPNLVFSRQVVDCLRQFEIMPSITFVPVHIEKHEPPAGGLFLPYAAESYLGWDFFNMKKSPHESHEGSPLYMTGDPVVREGSLSALDFVIVEQLNYIVSGKLKLELERREFTNIRFTELRIA
jgi:hypothetical protein